MKIRKITWAQMTLVIIWAHKQLLRGGQCVIPVVIFIVVILLSVFPVVYSLSQSSPSSLAGPCTHHSCHPCHCCPCCPRCPHCPGAGPPRCHCPCACCPLVLASSHLPVVVLVVLVVVPVVLAVPVALVLVLLSVIVLVPVVPWSWHHLIFWWLSSWSTVAIVVVSPSSWLWVPFSSSLLSVLSWFVLASLFSLSWSCPLLVLGRLSSVLPGPVPFVLLLLSS